MNKHRENFGGTLKLGYSLSLIAALTVCSARAVGQDCSYFASNYRQAVVSLSVEKTKKETGAVVSASGTGFEVG